MPTYKCYILWLYSHLGFYAFQKCPQLHITIYTNLHLGSHAYLQVFYNLCAQFQHLGFYAF